MDVSQLLRALGLQQAYQAYQQNIGEPFAAVVGGAGRGYLGLDKPEYGGLLSEEAYKTGQALGYMPGIGAPAGAFKVGAQAAAKAPGLLADAVQMMKANPEAGLLALTGYHGSPHRFSKFDASKIGSGEGAQAYGHGLYFAEAPETAKVYQEKLSGYNPNVFLLGDKEVSIVGGSPEWLNFNRAASDKGFSTESAILAYQKLRETKGNLDAASGELGWIDNPTKIQNDAADLLRTLQYKPMGGAFYTVDIPDDMIGKMIDWDKPIGRQSKQVKEAIQQTRSMLPQSAIDDLGGDLSLLYGPNVTVNQFLNTWESLTGKTGSGEAALRQFGVPGVKYFDEQSRQKGKGTRNFVVFPGEEEAVRILNVE